MTIPFTFLLVSLGFFVPELAHAKATKDKIAPVPVAIHIQSSNAIPTQAKAGDTVTLSFTASEKILAPIVLVETKTLFVKAKNTTGNSWDATYTVTSKDPKGKVDYLLTLVDPAGNITLCSSARIPFIKYCPTTDGSSVTIIKPAATSSDTVPPVIAPHADVSVTTQEASATVTYTLPVATDNKDGSVAVTCAPASGSTFAVGTTTVTCSAQDAAGNTAQSTFLVVVTQEVSEPEPYTAASQSDDSYLCGEGTGSWRYCELDAENNPAFGFTDSFESGVATIDLGAGTGLGGGVLQNVTIANKPADIFHPWKVSVQCFTASDYTGSCGAQSEFASESSDNKYWTAEFDGTLTFEAANYYRLVISDETTSGGAWEVPAYGSESKQEPYWVITGLR